MDSVDALSSFDRTDALEKNTPINHFSPIVFRSQDTNKTRKGILEIHLQVAIFIQFYIEFKRHINKVVKVE